MPKKYTIGNFGGNVTFSPKFHYQPRNESEVLDILHKHRGQRIHAGGSLHSWSDAPRGDDVYLDLRHLKDVQVNTHAESVRATVGAGCRIKRLLAELRRHGNVTLPTLGLITAQSVAGAISTGTHGSGRHSLSHYVQSVRLAGYDPQTGEVCVFNIVENEDLKAVRCGLGTMGVILSVTLACVPGYHIEEHAARYEALDEVLAKEEEYPLQQCFLIPWLWRYYAQHRRQTKSPRSRLASLYRCYWILGMDLGLHLWILALARLVRKSAWTKSFFSRMFPWFVLTRWFVVDRSEAMLVMHHDLFRHIEIEIFVTRRHLGPAVNFVRELLIHCDHREAHVTEPVQQQLTAIGMLDALDELRGCYTHHYPICIRRVLPDDTFISMASGDEPYYSVSLISYARPDQRAGFLKFARFLTHTAARLFQARPHWGKVCPLDGRSAEMLYPQMQEFRDACRRFDPAAVFCNDWHAQLLGSTDFSKQ